MYLYTNMRFGNSEIFRQPFFDQRTHFHRVAYRIALAQRDSCMKQSSLLQETSIEKNMRASEGTCLLDMMLIHDIAIN